MEPTTLLISPQAFFKDRVAEAMIKQKVSIDESLEHYIVNLLCEFIDPKKAFHLVDENEQSIFETPLALVYKAALEAPLNERTKLLKRLGDTSLYVSGYFGDYFNRKAFSVDYFISLGQTAYLSLAEQMKTRHSEDHVIRMFQLLAENFYTLVETVSLVSEVDQGSVKDIDILALYDRWTRTHSERLRKKLEDNGISPIPVSIKNAQ